MMERLTLDGAPGGVLALGGLQAVVVFKRDFGRVAAVVPFPKLLPFALPRYFPLATFFFCFWRHASSSRQKGISSSLKSPKPSAGTGACSPSASFKANTASESISGFSPSCQATMRS